MQSVEHMPEKKANTEKSTVEGFRDKAVVILPEPLDPAMTEARNSPPFIAAT